MPGPHHTLSLALLCPFHLKCPALPSACAGRHIRYRPCLFSCLLLFFLSRQARVLEGQTDGVFCAAWLRPTSLGMLGFFVVF